MPELPEVETVRRGLESEVVGRVVERVEVTGRRTVRRHSPDELVAALLGRRVVGATRFGKYLVTPLDDGAALVAHLRMSGQLLLVAGPAVALARHTHVVLGLDDGRELRFVDPRTFGELFVSGHLDATGRPAELATLGIDPLLEGLRASTLAGLLARRRTSLKAFLLDQRAIAGIGNLYADEICFRARLRPDHATGDLGPGEVRRLARAVRDVLVEAVECGGSSLRDERYRDLSGDLGRYQHHHAVYDRAGQPCPRCRGTISRARLAGRSAHFCDRCQA